MICAKELTHLINSLINADDTFADFQETFGEIGERYGIARVEYAFHVPANFFTKSGETRSATIYIKEGVATGSSPDYVKTFVTAEKGTARFSVYRVTGMGGFTEEETEDMETVLNVVIFHVARWRMINMIKDMRTHDSLTGIPNAGGFLTYVDALLEKKELSRFNAYYFNLSRFSLVNRRFGSTETDNIIIRYSEALGEFLMPDEMLARLGGDNYAALVRKERTEEFLQCLSGIATYGMLGDKKIPIKISAVAGIFEIDDAVSDNRSILNDAAIALNAARHVLKKPYIFVSDQMRQKGFMDKQIVSSFMEGLSKGEFKVYYQPKVSGAEYRVVGGEALSRWIKEDVMMQPKDFIPVIERNGMICLLDFYVLEQVCKDITEWLSRGMAVGRMSINFSRKYLSNPDLVENILNILQKYKMAGEYIEIELTETVDEMEANQLIDFIKQMKQHGIAVSIDDFGTGYSSLNMLRSFSVDVLKIDKSFIDDLDDRNKIVLSNIVRMSRELDMDVVAEGVETKEQAQYLKEIGCQILQGFLFDRPLPKNEFEEKMQNGVYRI